MAQKRKDKAKKRVVNVEPVGQAHIRASFNNIIISMTNSVGQVISWASAGKMGFKGSKKNTPYPAQMAGEDCAKKERKLTIAMERIKAYKSELERKNLIISKEKAAVKFYRHQSENKNERLEFLEKENERIVAQYKYIKNVYKARGAKNLK